MGRCLNTLAGVRCKVSPTSSLGEAYAHRAGLAVRLTAINSIGLDVTVQVPPNNSPIPWVSRTMVIREFRGQMQNQRLSAIERLAVLAEIPKKGDLNCLDKVTKLS